jgi:CubicO group peptidase (beta-lactamase class C family)
VPRLPPLPRPPIGPDPLRRIRVPRDLAAVTTRGDEEPARAAGLSEATVDRIWKAGVDLYRSGVHPALQLCVRRNGHVVLNRAIGHSRGNGPTDPRDAPKVQVSPDTPFCVYSTSKSVTALVVHMLHERGALDIEDRIVKYIPDYGQHGKDEITIAHVLSHRAGVAQIPPHVMELDNLANRELLIEALSGVKPSSQPGKMLAYHAVSGGFILGEVVRVATGKDIRTVLAEEILEPLGFRWMNYGVASEDVDQVGPAYVTGPRLLPPLSTLVTRALGQPLDRVIEISNDARFLTGIVPSANVVTNAEELSRFFEIFRRGGELDGVRVMEPETLRRALTEQSRMEIDFSLVFPTRFAYGLMLGAQVVSLLGLDTQQAFGHLGLINIMGWADPERGVAAGLVTSGKAIVYPEVARFYGVMQTIASEVPKLPRAKWSFVHG